MIADTTFISDFLKEYRQGIVGPARRFFAGHRSENIRTTIITAGELAVMFETSSMAWDWLAKWKIYPMHPGIAQRALIVN